MKTKLTDLTNNLSSVQTEAPRMLLAILSLLIVGLMINPKVEVAEIQDQTPQKVAAPTDRPLHTQVAKTR